jgi:hypothetical protein
MNEVATSANVYYIMYIGAEIGLDEVATEAKSPDERRDYSPCPQLRRIV